MIENHPFKVFAPPNTKYLFLGSFVARKPKDNSYDWYYSKKQNQFWPILEIVYNIKLKNKETKQDLLKKLRFGVADIISRCERKKVDSLDSSLINCVYNIPAVRKILKENPIEKIFFTSRFVEREFKKNFKDLVNQYPRIKLVPLPSPSPRYAVINIVEKIKIYSQLLPK